MWSRWTSSILLVLTYWIAQASTGSSHNSFKINPKPCTVNGIEGTCMFVWECIKSEGQHVGVCMDSFMFGSCCSHNLTENVIPQNYHQTVTYRPKPAGSNKYKPPKPSTFVSSNGYTTIYRPGNGGTLVIRPSHNHHHHQHQKPSSSSSSSSSNSNNINSHLFSQRPTEGTVNKHSTLSTPAQLTDLEMAGSSMSTGIYTTHWQATTEPSFITKTRPPKPSKPSKKPILSISNNIQSTVLKPKPSAKPTKPSTTTVKSPTQISIISSSTWRPPPSTNLWTTSTTTTTTTRPTTALSSTVVQSTSLASSPIDTNTHSHVVDVSASSVIGDEGYSSSPELYTAAPGRYTISAARNYDENRRHMQQKTHTTVDVLSEAFPKPHVTPTTKPKKTKIRPPAVATGKAYEEFIEKIEKQKREEEMAKQRKKLEKQLKKAEKEKDAFKKKFDKYVRRRAV
ncbi:hypothetical protein RP20_CCG012198 [Aedes albopictus]|nr:hypothetical protein RP20_CCG012198 [Aedes albopictus]